MTENGPIGEKFPGKRGKRKRQDTMSLRMKLALADREHPFGKQKLKKVLFERIRKLNALIKKPPQDTSEGEPEESSEKGDEPEDNS